MKPCDHVLLDSDTTVKVTHSRSAPEPAQASLFMQKISLILQQC